MNTIGMLCLMHGQEDGPKPIIITPAHGYFVVPPEACPDDWLALKDEAERDPDITVMGFIIDEGDTQSS